MPGDQLTLEVAGTAEEPFDALEELDEDELAESLDELVEPELDEALEESVDELDPLLELFDELEPLRLSVL